MKKYYHRKLVRDKIPDIIKTRGGFFKAEKATIKQARVLLKKKLVEEAKELLKADRDTLLKELSDVLQVIKSIGKLENIRFQDIVRKTKEKENYAGAFKKRIFLVWSDKPQGFGDKK